jgi:CDP-diacylglycerol pyrophosphatase
MKFLFFEIHSLINQKNDLVQLHVNFSKKVRTLPKIHMHIFNVSITTVQGLKNVNLKV